VYDRPLTIEQVLAALQEQPETIAALTANLTRARRRMRTDHLGTIGRA
jgi:hypothetical protein